MELHSPYYNLDRHHVEDESVYSGWKVFQLVNLAASRAARAAKGSICWGSLFSICIIALFMVGGFLAAMHLMASSSPNVESVSTRISGGAAENICGTGYSSRVLKLTREAPVFSIVSEDSSAKKFEASDIVAAHKNLYLVCDASFSLVKTGIGLEPAAAENEVVIPAKPVLSQESDWEALWLDETTGIFYVVQEALSIQIGTAELRGKSTLNNDKQPSRLFQARIQELRVEDDKYSVEADCQAEFPFESGNKGFEGVVGIYGTDNSLFLLGLCEGNHCKGGMEGRDTGNGRLVVMKKETNGDNCTWKTVKILKLPEEVGFSDYSSVTLRGNTIAIASQQDSRLWIGHLNLQRSNQDNKRFLIEDPNELKVLPGGRILYFPRDNDCRVVYCNIEGIAFIGERLIAATSDKAKKSQSHRCIQKDQSVHVFSLPEDADL